MAASSFLFHTFVNGSYINHIIFRKSTGFKKNLEVWSLVVTTIFAGYMSYYFIKMLKISYEFEERSEGADEILIWIINVVCYWSNTFFYMCLSSINFESL